MRSSMNIVIHIRQSKNWWSWRLEEKEYRWINPKVYPIGWCFTRAPLLKNSLVWHIPQESRGALAWGVQLPYPQLLLWIVMNENDDLILIQVDSWDRSIRSNMGQNRSNYGTTCRCFIERCDIVIRSKYGTVCDWDTIWQPKRNLW